MGLILGTILAVAKAAKVVVKAIAIADIAIKTLKVVGNALVKLGKTLGLIKPEAKVEDLGDKAIQSEYKPEDYNSYAEYVKAVEDYKLDPEKSKNISEEEKIELLYRYSREIEHSDENLKMIEKIMVGHKVPWLQ